jgi:hypothetical protein
MKKKKSRLQQLAGEKVVSSHAWRETWDRPLEVDEDSLDPLTIARMTDHNVRASDKAEPEPEPIAPVFEIKKDRAKEQPSQRRNREKKNAGG